MGKERFKELKVWEKAKDLAVGICRPTAQGPLKRDYGLCEQIQCRAASIASNIAEGDERETDKESVRFFYIAKGSLAELRTQVQIAYEIGYLDRDVYTKIESECIELGKMIGKLIKARQGEGIPA